VKAISLWQPWASLLFTTPRTKIHETRHWGTSHRGAMYIHAAKRPIREFDLNPRLEDLCTDIWGGHFRKDLPFGAIIGIVHLIDCVRTESIAPHTTAEDLLCGDFSPRRFAWSMGMPTPIGPWPYKGQQGMWAISESEMEAVANKALGITADGGDEHG
jgi:activating signal cointegrator 1